MEGLVVRNTGSWYEVRADNGAILQCKIKGNFRLRGIRSTNPVAVGDRVQLILNNDGTAFISEIEERKNYIIRKASNLSKQSHILAANIDQVLLFFTLKNPETSTVFIDRFLASAEAYRIPVTILFNKCDILDKEELDLIDNFIGLYRKIGYDCLKISVTQKIGLEKLPRIIQNKTTLLAGNSGVGKSSLLNYLIPGTNATTAPISETHHVGMHATTFSSLYELPTGGSLIDVPGVKGFGTFNFDPKEVSHYFRDIFSAASNCKFSNCMHLEEPGCAVCRAVEKGEIAYSRYQAYLSMLDDKEEGKYREKF